MNDNHIIEQKKVLRRHFERLRAGISAEEREFAETKILEHLSASDVFHDSDSICSFVSYGTEISTKNLNEFILASGKTLYLPRIRGHRTMDMIRVTPDTTFDTNTYGIKEPIGEVVEIVNALNTICIIPLLSYDDYGHRLGYGGGFYDAYLHNDHTMKKIGMCFSLQYSQTELPTEEHDIILDLVINELGIFCPQKK